MNSKRPDPVSELLAALDALPDERAAFAARLFTPLLALPPHLLRHVIAVGEASIAHLNPERRL